ncbi:MAG: multiprotein-bridging factor 1 family protein [Tardiphaga sp.]
MITARVLQWARNRAGISIEALADKLKVDVADVKAWEAETRLPTFAKARYAARVLHVPFGCLFLPEPPQESIGIPDLRSLGGGPAEQLGPDFYETYLDAKTKQASYRDYIIQNGGKMLPYVGSHMDNSGTFAEVERTSISALPRKWTSSCPICKYPGANIIASAAASTADKEVGARSAPSDDPASGPDN